MREAQKWCFYVVPTISDQILVHILGFFVTYTYTYIWRFSEHILFGPIHKSSKFITVRPKFNDSLNLYHLGFLYDLKIPVKIF